VGYLHPLPPSLLEPLLAAGRVTGRKEGRSFLWKPVFYVEVFYVDSTKARKKNQDGGVVDLMELYGEGWSI